jgi:hypothetical protein
VYQDGLRAGGDLAAKLDKKAKKDIATWRASQTEFVSKFVDDIVEGEYTQQQISERANMWVNKSLNPLYYVALAVGAAKAIRGLADAFGVVKKEPLFMWVYDPRKEHCKDCLRLNGQIHTMKEYLKKGILPQSPRLACNGYNCGCSLVLTEQKARGKIGGKSSGIRGVFSRIASLFKKKAEQPRDNIGRFGTGGGGSSGGGDDDNGGNGGGDDGGGKYEKVQNDKKFEKKWEKDIDNIRSEKGPPPGSRIVDNATAYTDEGYRKVNDTLRGTSDELLDQGTIEQIQDLDNLTNRRLLDKDIVTFRRDDGAGLPNGGDLTDEQFLKLKGGTFSDPAFTSTSAGDGLNDTFGDVSYEYRIPQGSRGAYVDSVSKHPNEDEFLLGRNTQSNIVDAKIEDGRRTLILEVMPDG